MARSLTLQMVRGDEADWLLSSLPGVRVGCSSSSSSSATLLFLPLWRGTWSRRAAGFLVVGGGCGKCGAPPTTCLFLLLGEDVRVGWSSRLKMWVVLLLGGCCAGGCCGCCSSSCGDTRDGACSVCCVTGGSVDLQLLAW